MAVSKIVLILVLSLTSAEEIFRLSKEDTEPIHYKVDISPYLLGHEGKTPFTFDGSVAITFRANREASFVVVHGKNLEINQTQWTLETDTGVLLDREVEALFESLTDMWYFPLAAGSTFESGRIYKLRVSYSGSINEDLVGLHRGYYHEGSQTKWLASTQFYPSYARSVFPCFDEPYFKATFELSVLRPQGFRPTLSNTKIKTRTIEGDLIRDVFETTPRMSTFSLAFAVHHLSSAQSLNDEKVTVFSRPEATSQTEFARDVGQRLLDSIAHWTNYSWESVTEIQKIDLIALPDLEPLGSANWGAIFMRESCLLVDPSSSQLSQKQRVAEQLASNVAKFWFGNLVSSDWWSESWLNDGFGKYFQYFGVDLIEKDWNMEGQFVVEELQNALLLDASPENSPLENNKAASILRWIEDFMGKERFQRAVQKYLKEHQYQTVSSEDLFRALENEAPEANTSTVFLPWTVLPGYPVVSVHKHDNHLHLSQKRFFLEPQESQTSWHIPMTVATDSRDFETTAKSFIFPAQTDYEWDLATEGDLGFYLLNVNQVGFYRVNYDSQNWNAIRKVLNSDSFEKVPPINRAQIIDDSFNLAQAAQLDISLFFDLSEYLTRERHYIPWSAALNVLQSFSRKIGNDELFEMFQKHVKSIVSPVYEHLGFSERENETHMAILNRAKVLEWACTYEVGDCAERAQNEFRKVHQGDPINPNVRPVVYCEGIRHGNKADFDLLWDKYVKSNVATEKETILAALGCSDKKEIVYAYLNLVFTNEIRQGDKEAFFNNAFSNSRNSVDHTLNFLIENFSRWETVMGSVADSIALLSSRLTSEDQALKVEKFANDTAQVLGEQKVEMLRKTAKDVQKNIEWNRRSLREFKDWYDRKANDGAAGINLGPSVLAILVLIFFRLLNE